MNNSILIIQDDLNKFSDELNNVNWSAFPIGEEFGVWIPIAVSLIIFFGFMYMAQLIENE